MKKHLFLAASALLALTACNNVVDLPDPTAQSEISFKTEINKATKVAGSNFETGDVISVMAIDEAGSSTVALYSYNGSDFTSDAPFTKQDGESLAFNAVYPSQDNFVSAFNFSIATDQSGDGYELSDLLVANAASTTSLQPTLSFGHKMSSLVLSFKLTDGTEIVPASVEVSALNLAACDVEAASYTGVGSATAITAAVNGTIGYKAIVAPQTIAAGEDFITMSYEGTTYTAAFSTEAVLLSGSQYTYELTADPVAGTIVSIDLIDATIDDWNDGNEGGTEEPENPDTTSSIVFDGSELPTSYPTDETITVGGIDFVINSVANFYEAYGSNGPIQFKSAESYLYNTDAISGLTEVIVTLAPEGTSYNNFTIYAGTSSNTTESTLSYTQSGDVCTYAVPEGSEYVRIENTSSYTAYAFSIEFSTTEGGTTPDPEPEPDPETPDTTDGVIFDGSELPTSYPTDETITVGGVDFVINQVANFSTLYETSGPIQFKKSESYLYNTDAISGLKEVIITLAPAGTTYQNFTVYAGTSANSTESTLSYTQSGDVCTYVIPEGSEYVKIENASSYTAYASQIEFSTTESGTTPDPEPEPEPEPETPDTTDGVIFDGSELPTSYPTDETITVGGVDFIINQVANFSTQYTTSGPIQFKSSVSYLYNTTPVTGIKEVIITLAPAGTSYNNFTVYAGTSANPTATTLDLTQSGDVCTYTVPEGSEYIRIDNSTTNAAYAFTIEFATVEGGTITPDPEEEPDEPTTDGSTVTADYDAILEAMGCTSDDVDASSGLAVVDAEFENFTLTAENGTATTSFRLWANDSTIRSYAGNEVTVTAKNGKKVTGVTFSATTITAASDGVAINTNAWTGSEDSITLTVAKGTNSYMEITVE